MFIDDEFLSSYVTDHPYKEHESICDKNTNKIEKPEAGSSEIEKVTNEVIFSEVNDIVSPEYRRRIQPFPKAARGKQEKITRLKGKPRILTDTSIENEIEEEKSHKFKRNVEKASIEKQKIRQVLKTQM